MASDGQSTLQAGLDEITDIFQHPEHENFDPGLILYKYLLLLSPQEILDYVGKVYGVEAVDAHNYMNLQANNAIEQQNAENYSNASKAIQSFIYATHDVPSGFEYNADEQANHSNILRMLIYLSYYIKLYQAYTNPDALGDAAQTLNELTESYSDYRKEEFGQATTEARAQANTQYVNPEIEVHLGKTIADFVDDFKTWLEDDIAQAENIMDIDDDNETKADYVHPSRLCLRLRLRLNLRM